MLGRRQDVGPWPAGAIVALLTLAGLALRLSVSRGLSLDEAVNVRRAHLGLGALIQHIADGGSHPPLYDLALWATVRLLGAGELAVRMPSIVAGALVVPLLYGIGHQLYDRRTGVLAALLGTVAPLLVWYAQEAQLYAFVTFFAALAVLGCVRALRHGGALDWVLYLLGASGLVWSDWFAIVVLLVIQAAFLVALVARGRRGQPRRELALGWAATTAVLALQLVPLGMLAAAQHRGAGLVANVAGATPGVSFYTVMGNLSWSLWGFQPSPVTRLLSAIWPLLMLLSLLLLGRGRSPRSAFLVAGWLAPVIVVLALGLSRPEVFDVRYFIAGLPLLLVLLARLVTGWGRSGAARVGLAAVVLATLLAGLADQQLNPSNSRLYDFRGALAQVRRHHAPGEVLLYEPAQLRYVVDRYAPGVPARPLDGPLPTRAQARRVVVVASFLDQPGYHRVVDRQLGALDYDRRREGVQRFPGVLVWRFR